MTGIQFSFKHIFHTTVNRVHGLLKVESAAVMAGHKVPHYAGVLNYDDSYAPVLCRRLGCGECDQSISSAFVVSLVRPASDIVGLVVTVVLRVSVAKRRTALKFILKSLILFSRKGLWISKCSSVEERSPLPC